MVRYFRENVDLTGRVAIITGANAGRISVVLVLIAWAHLGIHHLEWGVIEGVRVGRYPNG